MTNLQINYFVYGSGMYSVVYGWYFQEEVIV